MAVRSRCEFLSVEGDPARVMEVTADDGKF